MPPTYLEGVLYWMSDPRLSQSYQRAIMSLDIATNTFGVIPCPPYIAKWNRSPCRAFVVELEGKLCAVLADQLAKELDIWKVENGRWERTHIIQLEGWSSYSLGCAVVVPWAVYPKDGKILLNAGRKLGIYDPARQSIESLYDLDELLSTKSTTESSGVGAGGPFQIKDKSSDKCCRASKPPFQQNKVSDVCATVHSSYTEFMPLVPILYEESLASYPRVCKERQLRR
ncbi:unnamed protein product [Urochloa humidicola]